MFEEFVVIEIVVGIESRSSAFTSSCVRGINEKNRGLVVRVFSNGINPVTLNECDLFPDELDVLNAVAERFWVPAGLNPFPVFAVFQNTAAGRENPSMQGSVAKDRLESKIHCALWSLSYLGSDRFAREMKAHDPISELVVVVREYGLPDGGDAPVKFDHKDMIGKVLECNGEAYDPSASEWLDEERRLLRKTVKPLVDVWDEPCLSSRVTERTPLGDLCNIYHAFLAKCS